METVQIAKCPVCESFTLHTYYMQDAKTKARSTWYHCSCGVIWNANKGVDTFEDVNRYKDGGYKYKDSCLHAVNIYAPIIEESVYGRKMLEIGHTHPYHVEAMKDRGWVTYSIDKNPSYTPSDRFFVGDFNEYEFPEELRFDLIWAYHSIERTSDPIHTFKKMFNLLSEDGILFLVSPDTDFLHTRSSSNFNHWKPCNRIMWNRRSLTSYLEKLGFQTIVCRRNHEHRFSEIDNLHGIFQKKFI